MRIGITGSQGTGKSTLAVALARVLGLSLITEQARTVAKDLGIVNLRDLKDNHELGRAFQEGCLEYQIAAEKAHFQGFVSDRTTIDNAVYWLKHHAHRWDSETSNSYYEQALGNVKNYDLIVYVPPEILPVDDGFRSTNREYQLEIDTYIRAFISMSGGAFKVRGSVENRINMVLSVLEREGSVPYKPWDFCRANCNKVELWPNKRDRKILFCYRCKAYQFHQYLRQHGQILEDESELAEKIKEVRECV
jgi:nicotinamide riboside kinase